ncbi:MAG: tetratricopeptide repeat protein, partial [Myxococcales bacterium]|nr:tetratricopeptide repeat protein [Myxococcales bacterium]
IELHAEQGNWRGVQSTEQRHLAAVPEDASLVPFLLASGDRWLKAEDPRRAKERYAKARDLAPDDVEPVMRLIKVYDAEGAHEQALEMRRVMAERTADPATRARLYFELGETCLFELHRDTEAYEAFEKALDADPTLLEVLEVLATALADNQEWGELERIYAKMISTFASRPQDEATITVLAELHHRSALLYRDHLEDSESALDALGRELALRPGQLSARLMAVEIAVELEDGPRALDHLRAAAAVEPSRAETYRQLFQLGQRFDAPEIAFMAAGVCHVLGVADDRERIVYRELAEDNVPGHRTALSAEDWALLEDETRDRAVDGVMAAVAAAVLRTRIAQLEKDKKLPALREELRQDPETSTVSAVRSLHWAGRYLGVPCPALYVDPERTEAFHAPFAKVQTTVVGQGSLRGRTTRELAFLAGRHLAFRVPEHELVAHMNGLDELTLAFLAAVHLALGKSAALPGGGAVEAFARLLERQQTEQERAALEAAVKRFNQSGGRVNLGDWVRSVELCSGRVGLLLCGDVVTAAQLIEEEGDTPFATAKQRLDDLYAFAVSKAHARLRAKLGSSFEDHEDPPPLSAV